MHGIKVLMAKNYVDNLSEEVKKGMREKAEQGHSPSVAPIGYVNNLSTHRIEVDSVRGPLIARLFELHAREKCTVEIGFNPHDLPLLTRRPEGGLLESLTRRCV